MSIHFEVELAVGSDLRPAQYTPHPAFSPCTGGGVTLEDVELGIVGPDRRDIGLYRRIIFFP